MPKKVTLSKEEVLNALIAVRPGLAKKEIIEQATHVIFCDTYIATFNERICIQYPLTTKMLCSVVAEDLFAVIEGIKDEDLTLSLDGDILIIETENTKAELSTAVDNKHAEQLMQSLNQDEAIESLKALPSDFSEGLSLCKFSTSKTINPNNTHCICITDKTIISSDGYRVSKFNMEGEVSYFLLPSITADELTKYNLIEVAVDEGWTHFLAKDGTLFSAKTVIGDFTDYSDFFSVKGEELEFPLDIFEVLSSLAVLAEGEKDMDKKIEVSLEDDKATLFAEKQRGRIKKTIPMDSKGQKFKIQLNPFFLEAILKRTNRVTIDKESKLAMFKDRQFVHVFALEDYKEKEA